MTQRVEGGGLGRGVLLHGTVWAGGGAVPFDGAVFVDGRGRVDYLGPREQAPETAGLPVLGGPGYWIGPGVVDAHVHLAFGTADVLATGLVAVRDLGAPARLAGGWRTGEHRPPAGRPVVACSGPILTALGGYPSRSWGADGFAAPVAGPEQARAAVRRLAAGGADLIKIALEPGAVDWPVPDPVTVRAVVEAAHDAGLAVVAHALRATLVLRAVEAGVDELAHVPTQRLPVELVERIAAAGVSVVSTLQTFFCDGLGAAAAGNAVALHRAGVVLRYGTDLGNAGTRAGVDPRELDRLAECGLGRLGALRAATELSAAAAGIRGRSGLLRRGEPAALVVLPGDPLIEPGVWRAPTAVVADGRLIVNWHTGAVSEAGAANQAGGGEAGAANQAGGGEAGAANQAGGGEAGAANQAGGGEAGAANQAGGGEAGAANPTPAEVSAPVAAQPPGPGWRERWAPPEELRLAGALVLALAVLGALFGIVWQLWSPPGPLGVVVSPGAVEADETEAFVASDGRFAVLALSIGVLAGLFAWYRGRARGPAAATGLAVGGVVGAVLMNLVGHLIRGGSDDGRTGTLIRHLPLSVHMTGILFFEAGAGLLVYLLCAAFASRDDLGRPDPSGSVGPPGSVGMGGQLQHAGGDADAAGGVQQRDLPAQ